MSDNELLTHVVKALAYRFTKAADGSAADFGMYQVSLHSRSPNEILNHMNDLVIKTITMVQEGHFTCPPPEALDFEGERNPLLDGFEELQKMVNSSGLEAAVRKRLLQGTILDIATHIGQLVMLNGLNGNKIQKENYYEATII
ncbi:hypothetical protein GCM10027592_58310 [Spirosoma flavus]